MPEWCVTLEKCGKPSAASSVGGNIVGGGKRAKTQSLSVSPASRGHGRVTAIDKQKFYSSDPLMRPPLRRTRRSPATHQLSKAPGEDCVLLALCLKTIFPL